MPAKWFTHPSRIRIDHGLTGKTELFDNYLLNLE
jgi:hypothetical protein